MNERIQNILFVEFLPLSLSSHVPCPNFVVYLSFAHSFVVGCVHPMNQNPTPIGEQRPSVDGWLMAGGWRLVLHFFSNQIYENLNC